MRKFKSCCIPEIGCSASLFDNKFSFSSLSNFQTFLRRTDPFFNPHVFFGIRWSVCHVSPPSSGGDWTPDEGGWLRYSLPGLKSEANKINNGEMLNIKLRNSFFSNLLGTVEDPADDLREGIHCVLPHVHWVELSEPSPRDYHARTLRNGFQRAVDVTDTATHPTFLTRVFLGRVQCLQIIRIYKIFK